MWVALCALVLCVYLADARYCIVRLGVGDVGDHIVGNDNEGAMAAILLKNFLVPNQAIVIAADPVSQGSNKAQKTYISLQTSNFVTACATHWSNQGVNDPVVFINLHALGREIRLMHGAFYTVWSANHGQQWLNNMRIAVSTCHAANIYVIGVNNMDFPHNTPLQTKQQFINWYSAHTEIAQGQNNMLSHIALRDNANPLQIQLYVHNIHAGDAAYNNFNAAMPNFANPLTAANALAQHCATVSNALWADIGNGVPQGRAAIEFHNAWPLAFPNAVPTLVTFPNAPIPGTYSNQFLQLAGKVVRTKQDELAQENRRLRKDLRINRQRALQRS